MTQVRSGTAERRWLGLAPVQPPPVWFGVGLAAVLIGLGTAAHWLIAPLLAVDLPFITYFPVVLAAAVWGGIAGGATATGLAMILGVVLFMPHHPKTHLGAYLAPMMIMLLSGALIMLIGETLTRTLRALAASEERLRLLVKATAAFVIRLDQTGERLFPNPDWRAFTGQKYERRPGAWREMFHEDDRAALPVLTGEPVQIEARLKHAASQAHRWARISLTPVLRGAALHEWLGAVEDIHERKVVEEHGKTLAEELAHRARNGIAVVQAIVMQSARGAASPDDLRDTLIARLQAMSRAQEALDLERGETASMGEIIERVLAPFDSTRFDVVERGQAVLGRQPAITLALVLYELATNAAKYGALTEPGGRITIEHGGRLGDLVTVSWRETGGPIVKPSERRGFGHRLLEAGPANLGGASEIRMEPAGVVANLSFRAQASP